MASGADLLKFDIHYLGEVAPVAVKPGAASDDTSLDTAYLGQVQTLLTDGASAPTSVTGTGSSSQGQGAAGTGTTTSTGTGSSSQGQGSDGTAEVIAPGGATAQGQGSAGTASTGDAIAGTSAQGQSSAGTATVGTSASGSSEQGQSSAGAASAFSPWTLAQSVVKEGFTSGSGSSILTSDSITFSAGNLIVVFVAWGNFGGDGTATLTSSLGDVFTPGTRVVAGAGPGNGRKGQLFYCRRATGGTGTIELALTVAEQQRKMRVWEFRPPAGYEAQFYEETTRADSTTETQDFTSATYTVPAQGIIAVGEAHAQNLGSGNTEVFTSGFTTDARGPTQYNTLTGYKIPGGAESGTVTYDSNSVTSYHGIATMSFGVVSIAPNMGATEQGQSALGFGGIGWTGTGSSEQAQSADGTGDVRSVQYVGISGVAGTGAAGSAGSTHAVPVIGIPTSGQVGALRADRSRPVTGISATGQVGAVAPGTRRVAATGVQVDGATGTIAGTHRARNLTGVAAVGHAATIFARLRRQLAGVEGAGTAGFVAPPSGLSGVLATGRVGTVRTRRTVALSGNESSGAIGAVTPARSRGVVGVSTTGAVSGVSTSRVAPITGESSTTSVGTVATGQHFVGVAGSGTVGSVGTTRTIALTGVASFSHVGRVGNIRPSDNEHVFVSTLPTDVTLRAEIANVFIVSSAVSVVVSTPSE